ncbi:MAG: hypothetical protein Q9198_004956 [Flavoplaca austrocitrina]
MAPSKPAYDIDWIWSNNSNVHVANHRDWFISYTPFNSIVGSFAPGNGSEVVGIGDVDLPTKSHPTRNGAAYQKIVRLKNVLHVPSFFYNVFATNILEEYGIEFGGGGPTAAHIFSKPSGARVALIDRSVLYRVRLCGQSAKQTSLQKDLLYYVNALWSPTERAKWQAHQQKDSTDQPGGLQPANNQRFPKTNDDVPLTKAENKWLKDNYNGEFHFLQTYGLSIYKDEDRVEGRRILRAMMEDDSDDAPNHSGDERATFTREVDDTEVDSDEEGSQGSFERDLEENPASHAADYHFSEEQLDWIKRSYGHSLNFLMSYGLKFYDDEDCEEGVAIVRAFMSDDEE